MNNKYTFKLTAGYCLKNGIAVMEQKGASIKFLIRNTDDEVLKQKLRNAFCDYIRFVTLQKDCSRDFKHVPKVEFIGGNFEMVKIWSFREEKEKSV